MKAKEPIESDGNRGARRKTRRCSQDSGMQRLQNSDLQSHRYKRNQKELEGGHHMRGEGRQDQKSLRTVRIMRRSPVHQP